jgi:uncharacterized protein (DUF433 family)
MQLESYFNFANDTQIRIKGTRVGIESVLRDYWAGLSPEEIALRYATLSLEQVHATITYYLANRKAVLDYVARVKQQQLEGWTEQQQISTPFVASLRSRLEQHRQSDPSVSPM